MTSSLKLPHKRLLIISITAFLAALFLLQSIISYRLNKNKPKILQYLNNTFVCAFTVENLSFSFLRGLHIKNAALFYDAQDKPAATAKDIFFTVSIPELFLKRLALRADINEAALSIRRIEGEGLNLQVIFSDMYKKLSSAATSPPLPAGFKYAMSASVKAVKIVYADNPQLEKNMDIILSGCRLKQDYDKFSFNSRAIFNYRVPADKYISRFFKNPRDIRQEMKCAVEGRIEKDNLKLDLVSINVGEDEIFGTGINKGFAEKNPYLDITFNRAGVSLEHIPAIKDNLDAQGQAFFFANLKGLMDNVRLDLSGALRNCNFRYIPPSGDPVEIKKLNGEIKYKDGLIKLNNASFMINTLLLNADLAVKAAQAPAITLNIAIPKEFLLSHNLPLEKIEAKFNGLAKKTLQGELSLNAIYVRKGSSLNMLASLKDIDFDYANPEAKYLKIGAIEMAKESPYQTQKLKFDKLKAKVYLAKDKIEIKYFELSGYGAAIRGKAGLDMRENKTSLRFALEGIGLDIKSLMQDAQVSDKLLSGSMNIEISFDNQKKEFLRGACYIKRGKADLSALADIVKLPPLNNADFNSFYGRFSLSKESIKVSEIRLISPQIICKAHWSLNNGIDGLISLSITRLFLQESKPFRRLLNLTKIKDPYIDFSFLLGGIPRAVRIMWQKGEFKDRIKQSLPDWVERRIEADLNKAIDELSSQ